MRRNYTILAIDTSCDETSAAVTMGKRVFSNVVSSQVELHKKYGGVVPILAQRAHKERIKAVITEALRRASVLLKRYDRCKFAIANLDAIAVTYGPGLAPALEVGIAKARQLAKRYQKPLIAVNHMEGHLLSPFAQNSRGNSPCQPPAPSSQLPLVGLLVSGGHTQLVLMRGFGDYELLGETLDDACGEAFDKVAKILGLGYPGGPIIERLAKEGKERAYELPVPMLSRKDLNFSFSGLKTALLYLVRDLKKQTKENTMEINKKPLKQNFVNNQVGLGKEKIADLCASFQRVVAASLINKLEMAVYQYQPKGILLGGGVISNLYLRRKIRLAMRKHKLAVFVPHSKRLFTDNAAMIGLAAYFKARRGEFVSDLEKLEREPNLSF